MACDMTYRNTLVTCVKGEEDETVGTRPSCPRGPMPMISTPKKSYIYDYTDYLYAFPRDAQDRTRPYSGTYATGTPGDASRTFQLIGNTPVGSKRLASCTAQLRTPSNPSNITEWAKLIRLQLDNCANQYILNAAIYPFQKETDENSRLFSLEDLEDNPEERIGLRTECQPLATFRETENEYKVSTYLEAAWRKTMHLPAWRMSTPSQMKCMPCFNKGDLPCDREPHLPCAGPRNQGMTIDNPTPPPSPFPEVTLSQIGAIQYEEIVDPTHPFSPRWDFNFTDRDYSNPSPRWLNAQGDSFLSIGLIYGQIKMYMSESKNAVFCAGVKSGDPDEEVQVDVLEFRRDKFEDTLARRVTFNHICYRHRAMYTSGWDAYWYVLPFSFCNIITGFSIYPPYVFGRDFDCWECFGLSGQIDGESQTPPCATSYIGKDRLLRSLPGGLNFFKPRANCGDVSMTKACEDLRKPFTPINKLKMRYHNPDKDEANSLTEEPLEGLTFQEYFGNHMPYPRLWDTGSPLLNGGMNMQNYQPPLDTTGQYTAIVGVGREGISKEAGVGAAKIGDKDASDVFTDQRCKTMGWNNNAPLGQYRFAGVSVYWPDPMTSWTELKLYQARTLRSTGISCIARYEKVFKPGSSENLVLMATGAKWDKVIISKCDRQNDTGATSNCEAMTLQDYIDSGAPDNSESTVYMQMEASDLWPSAWRGYMAADEDKFPSFGGDGETIQGLDNAQVGDILMMPHGPRGVSKHGGLAKVGLVIETQLPNNSDCAKGDRKGCYIRVLEADNGKWPDICGTTDTWGEMKSRYYYKPGHLPPAAAEEYAKIRSTGKCYETRISHCEMTGWDSGNVSLYRIRNDHRIGSNNDDPAKTQAD